MPKDSNSSFPIDDPSNIYMPEEVDKVLSGISFLEKLKELKLTAEESKIAETKFIVFYNNVGKFLKGDTYDEAEQTLLANLKNTIQEKSCKFKPK